MIKKFIIYLFSIIFLNISISNTVNANPWLVFEGINLGIYLLDEISGKNSKKKKNNNNNPGTLTETSAKNKSLTDTFPKLPEATTKYPYDGIWSGYDSCRSRNNNKRDFDYTLVIDKGNILLLNQHAISFGQKETNFKSLVMKGKVLKNQKVGMNGIYGFLGGKFSSKNRLVLNYQDDRSCKFTVSKLKTTTNFNMAKTNENNNINIFYCMNENGKTYTLNKSIYKSCGYKEITESEYLSGDVKLASNKNEDDKKYFYCENENGQVYNLSKSIYKSCGYKEITKSKYEANKNKQIAQNNNNNNKFYNDKFYKKAQAGDAQAQSVVGERFEKGYAGYEKNYSKAIRWYKKSASQNFSWSLNKLGTIYFNGSLNQKKSRYLAFDYFNRAVLYAKTDEDIRNSNYNLGLFYKNGYGMTKINLSKARELFLTSYQYDNVRAKNRINEIDRINDKEKTNTKSNSKSIYDLSDDEELYYAQLSCKYNRDKEFKKRCDKIKNLKTNFKPEENNAKQKIIVSKEINQNVEIAEDTLSPTITVEKKFIADENFTANVNGIVTDDSEIVFFSIDGEEVAINNNQFSSSFYVKSKGRLIEIIAIDTKGNKTSKFVELKREIIEITKKVFDNLDPRKIKIAKRQNTAALIIGIENYENTVSAPFAENDALTFQDFALLTLGVPQENMKILINNEAKKTNTLKSILKWLPQVIKEDQTELYVFFSGHGLASENGEELYLLPSDGDPELLADSTLFRNRMFEDINKLNPKSVTVFLDTCYSGGTRSDEFLVAAKPIFIEAEEQEVPTNFTIFSASAGKETAKVLEEAEHGLFSYFMMKGLEGEADTNNDRTITNGELHAFINKNVSRQANQTPQLNGDPNQVLITW